MGIAAGLPAQIGQYLPPMFILAALRPGLAPKMVGIVVFLALAMWFGSVIVPPIADKAEADGVSKAGDPGKTRAMARQLRRVGVVVLVVGLAGIAIAASL